MRTLKFVMALALAILVPSTVFAQASITGTVKDTSGAVLPGVTVDAASPALIEKVRSATTDGTGQFRIVDLRPGTYSITFTLPGFNTVKREGVELSGSNTVLVNIDMKVGALEETVTVTGEAPVVDTQNTTKQQVLNTETIAALPTGRNYQNLGALIPGISMTNNGNTRSQDVGGSLGDNMAYLSIHGSRAADMKVTQNGVSTATQQTGGAIGGSTPNMGAAQEVTIDTSSVSAELAVGGPRINLIPRDGGNDVKGTVFGSFTNDALQSDNLTDRVKARGLLTANSNKLVYDVNPGVGGPIKKDKLWFYSTGRYNVAQNFVGGMFHNVYENQPLAYKYEADTSRPAYTDSTWKDAQIRLTYQANAKNKVAFTYDQQERCSCPWSITATRAPEAGTYYRFPTERLLHAEWSSPVTNKVLLEAVAIQRVERWGNMHPFDEAFGSANAPGAITVVDQGGSIPNLQYNGAGTYNNTWLSNFAWRAAVSYVTGAHQFKAGVNDSPGVQETRTYNFQPLQYRFNNGVPNQITEYATPYFTQNYVDHDLGLFAQDKWTINRLTLSGGVRFDYFASSFGESRLFSGPLVPGRDVTVPKADNLSWKDITPRMGAVYDVFGNGKTAVKISLNKYLSAQGTNGLATAPNPVNTTVNSTTRSWSDNNGDKVVDCDLVATGAQSPATTGSVDTCGAMANPNFGKLTTPSSTYDPDLLTGWGHRFNNWEFSTSVQQEILPRVSMDIGYFRRWFGNFTVTDNLTVPSTGYDKFTFTVPGDSRLPNGGNYQVTAFDLNPAYFGLPANSFNTLSDKYGKMTEHWNGVDFSINARLQNGVLLSGGVSTGRDAVDACELTAQIPEMLLGGLTLPGYSGGAGLGNVWLSPDNCKVVEKFQTQAKFLGIYTLPKVGVQVSGTYQNVPGPVLAASFVASNALVSPSLGRNLSGNASNTTVNIIDPASVYGDRINQLDLRFSKSIRAGRTRTAINVDIANALNSDAIVNEGFGYNPANAAAWRRATELLSARFIKFGVNFDF
jgi:hypothetical protein